MYQISTLHYVKKHWLGSSVLRIWSHLLKKSLMENFIFLYSEYLGGLTSKPQPLLQILEKTEKLESLHEKTYNWQNFLIGNLCRFQRLRTGPVHSPFEEKLDIRTLFTFKIREKY